LGLPTNGLGLMGHLNPTLGQMEGPRKNNWEKELGGPRAL